MKPLIRLAAIAALAVLTPTAAHADALMPPEELSEAQKLLIGVWQEEGCAPKYGRGHGCLTRTVAFGNTTIGVLNFGGVAYSQDFTATAQYSDWSASISGDKITVEVREGGTYELVMEGNAFSMRDMSQPEGRSSRFTRIGNAPKLD